MSENPASASAGRLQRRREAKKDAILRAAGAELAAFGFTRASLDNIAERVHITKATLYYYFESKEALYQAWMQVVSADVHDRISAIAGRPGPAAERLRAMIHEEVLLLTTEFPDFARLFMAQGSWPPAFQEEIAGYRAAHEELFHQVIEEGVSSGEFEVVDMTVARYCLQGALAFLPEWTRPEGRLAPAELAALFAQTMIRLYIKE